MNKTITTLIVHFCLTLSIFAADDYILGKYEHVDKLTIQYHTWYASVEGEGKYVAGFIETFYDNLSENYRTNPKLRKLVLQQMEDAKKSGKKGFNLTHDHYWIAFDETTGGNNQ